MTDTNIRVGNQFVTLEFLLDAYHGVDAATEHLGVSRAELFDAVERWASSPIGRRYRVHVDRENWTVSLPD